MMMARGAHQLGKAVHSAMAATLGAMQKKQPQQQQATRALPSLASKAPPRTGRDKVPGVVGLKSMSPVPAGLEVVAEQLDALANTLSGRRVAVLTGAGVSTASGIPDYRSPGRGEYTPMTHGAFVKSAATRQRYWARSFVGYPWLSRAQPNATHSAVAQLGSPERGLVCSVITQNVDGLHQVAGSSNVLELHGSIHSVECMQCDHKISRQELQQQLAWINTQEWHDRVSEAMSENARPDGDVELLESVYEEFKVADCSVCGGQYKPSVVFFGGAIPTQDVARSLAIVEEAEALLTLGTTLTTWSSFRLAKTMAAAGKPIAIVNYGATRADELATVRVEGDVGSIATALAQRDDLFS